MSAKVSATPGLAGRQMSPENAEKFTRWVTMVTGDGADYLAAARALGVPQSSAYSWWMRARRLGLVDENTPGGPNRRLTPEAGKKRAELLWRLVVLEGLKVEKAASRVGLSANQAYRILQRRGWRGSETERNEHAPDPIPMDNLKGWAADALAPDGSGFALFRGKALGRSHNPPWAAILARQLLELFFSPDDEYVVVNAPPGIGKSTLMTHDIAIYIATLVRAMGGEPTILLGHRAWQKSTWYLKRIRTTLVTNTELTKAFGRYKPDDNSRWSVEELEIELLRGVRRAEKEPTFAAGSYDASLLSGRFKVVMWDDLIDKTNSGTAEMRGKLESWNDNEAESRLEPGGLYILSNARYGPEDLSFSVTQDVDVEDIDENTGAPRPFYSRIRFKSHDDTKCDGQHHTGPWPDGCLLDPERATWKRIRRQIAKDEGRYLLVWQQEDTDPTGSLAQRAWFEGGTDEAGARVSGCFDYDRMFGKLLWDLRVKAPHLSAVSVDPSSSHYWAIAHYLGYGDREHVVHRALRRPMQAPDLLYIDESNPGGYVGLLEDWWQASMAEGVPFHYVIMEANAAQKWAMQYPFFMRWANSREVAIIPHTTTINKTDAERGVEMLRPVYQFAKIHIPYGGYEEKLIGDAWRREACAWPDGQTSDLVMQHWFYTHRMDVLTSTEIFEGAEPDTSGIPTWAADQLEIGAPAWVDRPQESLDRATSLLVK